MLEWKSSKDDDDDVVAFCTSTGSFAGLGFLAWYLSGKIRAFDRRGHIAKLCIIFLPLLAAALVGVSRVDDYWHHWQDVFAGAVIGLLSSFSSHSIIVPHSIPTIEFNPNGWWGIGLQGRRWLPFVICSSSFLHMM